MKTANICQLTIPLGSRDFLLREPDSSLEADLRAGCCSSTARRHEPAAFEIKEPLWVQYAHKATPGRKAGKERPRFSFHVQAGGELAELAKEQGAQCGVEPMRPSHGRPSPADA